jgi:TolB-like protein/DNA-binding winged helix-turn-helix (wHTH) protein/Flp pilus assembly protein TadD
LNLSAHDQFSVAGWRVYPASNEMRRAELTLQLEPKVMALLTHLAGHAGQTVSREQLFEALWPGLVVSDDTLTQAVIKLRKALGDSAKNARYIQTIPKRGYRLTAPVELFTEEGDQPPKTSRKGGPAYAMGLVVVLITGLLALYFTRIDVDAPITAGSEHTEASTDERPSLTVLPFKQLGDDASQDYLAQGLTYDLITDLSRLSGLWVIGSRSIMGQKRGPPSHMPARYLVSGEVQRNGDELRIHVYLVDGQSGHQLWAERFHRPFDNLFQVQEEISRRITDTLSLKVNEVEHRRLAHRYTHNVQAYDYFLQAQALLLVRLKPENESARRLYQQAIDLDPTFARAYAGLALSYAADFRNRWVQSGTAALEQARKMAQTALEMDAEIPEVYWVLAYVSAQQRHHEQALERLRQAIALDQSFADAYALMGGIQTYRGHPGETPALIRTAIRLNPEAGYLYFLLLGRAYFFLGDWEQASINLREALARNPANLEAHLYMAALLSSSGDEEGAAWEAQEVLTLQPAFDGMSWLATYPLTDPVEQGQLLAAWQAVGLKSQPGSP